MCYKDVVKTLNKSDLTNNRLEILPGSYRFGLSLPPTNVSFSLSKLYLTDNKMIAMKYTTLLAVARRVVLDDSESTNPEKTVANFSTAVRRWLEFLGKDEHKHNVGSELNTNFEEGLASYLNQMLAAGLSSSTVRDRKSAIRRLHSIYHTQISIDRTERSSELGTELRRVMLKLDMSAKELGRRSKVSFSFIQRVLTGSKPQKEVGIKNFRRIESTLLGLGAIKSRGHFIELICQNSPLSSGIPASYVLNSMHVEEANKYFKNKTVSPLPILSVEWLKNDAHAIYIFLENYAQHKNQQRAWSLKVPSRKSIRSPYLWTFRHNGKVVHSPTFERYVSGLTQILSFLMKYQNISLVNLNDPLIFLNSNLYIQYIDFLAERRDGLICGAGTSVITIASELIKEVSRQLKEGLVVGSAKIINVDVLDEVSLVRRYFKRFANSGRVRDPWQRLAPLLELEDPARPLAELSKLLSTKAVAPQIYLSHAIDLRDAFLLAFLLALPVRERTCIHLTYKEDGSGHLRYSKREQVWRIEIPARQVKNQRSISRTLPSFLNATIERYLGEARPRLLNTWGAESENIDFLFVSSYRDSSGVEVLDEITGELYAVTRGQMLVSSRLGVITKKHLGLSIRAHAFRHITATRFLKMSPGQHQACADLLADSLETVMSHYAYHDAAWNDKVLNDSISKAFTLDAT